MVGLRTRLRERNLYDTRRRHVAAGAERGDERAQPGRQPQRSRLADDGDDRRPLPGRNVPLEHPYPEPADKLLGNRTRVVNRELLTRDEFIPATIVNVLAAAWLQFEVHDWFMWTSRSGRGARARRRRPPGRRGRADPRTRRDPDPVAKAPRRPTSRPTRTGGTARRSTAAAGLLGRDPHREGGKLRLDPDNQLPRDLDGHRPDRSRRQLLARPRAPAHALHARAQRDLRPARARSTPTGTTTASTTRPGSSTRR